MFLIDLLKHVQFIALLFWREMFVAQILDGLGLEILYLEIDAADRRALVSPRQEAITPVALSAMIILVPILVPLLTALHIDLVHFGIILLVNLVIGQLTPPVGVLLFVAMTIAKVSLNALVREIWPFVLGLIVALAVITYVPATSLALPKLFGL